jgi:4-amino-4-deoxy-L-arabinose transferase-like glycosyltransferase
MKSKTPVRVGLALVVLAYLVYSSFGILAPFWWGHHGYHGATYMLRARMTLRFHMLAPATYTGYDYPPSNALYFHHPVGYHHLLSLLVPIFGEHEWLARGLAVVGGLFALWALYCVVKKAWARETALIAVAVYVFLPIIPSFSVLSDPMLIELACVMWSLWAYFDLLERPSTRALVHAAAAYVIGGLMMWEVFFIAPFIAAHGLFYSFTRRGARLRLGPFNAPRLHGLVIGAACVTAMGFHIWFTHHAGVWDEFLESYRIRHSPPSAPYVIDRHTQWMDLLYGRTPIVFAAIWFVLWLARVATGRARLRDLAPLTFLYVNTLYIYMFAEGSSVHLYRVFFYSGFFALAVADLVDDAARGARALVHRPESGLVGALLVLGVYFWAELPHTYQNWIDSRVLMGTHGQAGYDPDAEKLYVARKITEMTKPDERVIVHYGELGARKEMWYYLDRSFDNINSLVELEHYRANFPKSVLFLDEKYLGPHERPIYERMVKEHPVTFYDRFAVIDLRSNKPGVKSYALVPGPMSRRYKWWVSHKYPPLRELRVGYVPGICTAMALGVPVATDEDVGAWPQNPANVLCYRNYLTTRGEKADARHAEEQALAGMTRVSVPLGSGRIVGIAHTGGKLKLAIEAGGPEKGELHVILRRNNLPELSLSLPGVPPPSSWHPGFLYLDEVPFAGAAANVSVELSEPPPALPVIAPFRFRQTTFAVAQPRVISHADLGALQ